MTIDGLSIDHDNLVLDGQEALPLIIARGVVPADVSALDTDRDGILKNTAVTEWVRHVLPGETVPEKKRSWGAIGEALTIDEDLEVPFRFPDRFKVTKPVLLSVQGRYTEDDWIEQGMAMAVVSEATEPGQLEAITRQLVARFVADCPAYNPDMEVVVSLQD